MNGVTAMDENGEEIKSPIRRLGSTRKLLVFNNIRLQLNEQLRCLDVRVESQVSLIQELQDFFRRRAELESDYSKSLDKLAKTLQLRHKEQKQKREQWPLFSSYACWQQLINQTKSLSKDHAVLSEIYSVHLVARLQTVCEDVQRIYKRCREICYETHEEILRVLQELHTTTKTYHSYQTECKAAEAKLRTAESQRQKLQQSIPKDKLERSKKYRLTEKEVLKRKNKYTDARLKALKAKNEYQLCLEASNTTIHKYFVEDLSDLIDCMDLGFCSMVSRAILMHVTADQGRCRAIQQNAESISHTIQSMDSRADKQKFLEQHSQAFMIPKRIEFQGQQNEDPIEPELQKAMHQEMEQRLQLLGVRLNNLRAESEEIWKTLETAEKNLLEHLNTKDYDTSTQFGDGAFVQAKPIEAAGTTTKLKADKQEIEDFYLSKIREYILGTSRIARLDAKAELIRNALEKDAAISCGPVVKSNIPKRKRIGRMNPSGQPKLFGGSLEEYLEATSEDIPLIMRSCIRVINLYGLHHQGIFRVSGSQVEISNFREGFERGEDPLADTTDASDINSVAGVLKLYLRELREPLFPIIYFEQFIALAKLESKREIVLGIKNFLQRLPRSVLIVLRYLFAFLNHLSEYADENMMDAYNLAICFGPTLMPAPEDKDQVQYQNQINEIIKNMIQYHEELFPKDLGGIQYEKYISDLDIDVGDSPTDQVTEDPDSEVYPSEDESDTVEATAQFDFNARSNRELSLRKGDMVVLRKQVSTDWWQGTVNGKDGLVPDKYISLKIKDEDRDKTSEHLKSSSSEESVRKRRPSGNISINSQLSVFGQQQLSVDDHHQHHPHHNQQPITKHSQHISQPPPQQQQPQQPIQIQAQPIHVISSDAQYQHQQHVHQLLNEKIETIAANNKSSSVGSNDECDYHYESVDNVKNKYNYHDQPHSFENSMDFLEDINHFQYETKKPSEPIYAEPSKIVPSTSTLSTGGPPKSSVMHFDEYDGVVLRPPAELQSDKIQSVTNRKSETIKSIMSEDSSESGSSNTSGVDQSSNDLANRHSDGDLFRDVANEKATENVMSPTRKYHTKSFSLSENRIGVSFNMFQQNRELWEKRAELNSQQSLNQSRILERKRVAPDLVMDLPFSVNKDESLGSSRDSLDTEVLVAEELTSAERFAAQNQCTLKKNERFLTSNESFSDKKEVKLETKPNEKPKAEVKPQEIGHSSKMTITDSADDKEKRSTALENVLHIDENFFKDVSHHLTTTATGITTPKECHKSPIPIRNTQKYVTQFADLKLTGGCLSQSEMTVTTNSQTAATNPIKMLDQTPQLTSFKPQVRVKPQILKKTFVRPPTTPEMQRRGGAGVGSSSTSSGASTSSSTGSNCSQDSN